MSSSDTVIFLPKSGKTIIIDKNLPADKIKILDKYMSKHEPIESPIINPDALQCGYYREDYWATQDFYKPVTGKWLGIWTNKVDWQILHDRYGFTNICTNFYETGTAMSKGFAHDSILVRLDAGGSPSQIQQELDAIYNGFIFKYFYIDEPYIHSIDPTTVHLFATIIYAENTASKLLFTDYYWPHTNVYCWNSGNEDYLEDNYLSEPNTYIMCDQYGGNLCGNEHDTGTNIKGYMECQVKIYQIG